MKIDSLSRLLSSFGSSSYNKANSASTQSAPSRSSEQAVTLSQSIQGQESDEASRAERVATLKTQVANGTYNPSSQVVAEAVARELFA